MDTSKITEEDLAELKSLALSGFLEVPKPLVLRLLTSHARLREEKDAWKQLAEARGGYLIEYDKATTRAEAAERRVSELEAQVRVAYGFNRDEVFANIDNLHAQLTALRAVVGEAVDNLERAVVLVNKNRNQGYGSYGDLTRAVNTINPAIAAIRAKLEEGETS